jgi:protein-S-isoprenylcysteine O-methyltransferase Ste14
MIRPMSADRGPDVRFPPPLLFVGGLVAAWLLHRWLPFEIDGQGPGAIQTAIGSVLILAGLALMLAGIVTFVRARTPVIPHRPARALVRGGPFRFSRNPMYVGLTVVYLGLSVVLNAAWPLVLLPVVLAGLVRFVVAREERYLGETFGDEYAEYCRRVPRFF